MSQPVTGPGAGPEESGPLTVLFVCTANICRSAFAQQTARHLAGDHPGLRLVSAGTHGWTDHPVEETLAAELDRRGIAADGFASRPLTMAMVDEADLVLTMSRQHRQFILDDRPGAVWRAYTLGQFARTIADVPDDLTGRDLLAACRGAHKPATAEDDVADPYRQGPEAAAVAADHIEGLLRQIVPRLV